MTSCCCRRSTFIFLLTYCGFPFVFCFWSLGLKTHERKTIREGVVKIITKDDQRKQCPHYDQVRLVAFHHISAKGPIFARSLTKKALGNEEFCMQVDAHTDFVKDWDTLAVEEWKKTNNEFGVISTVPAAKAEKDNDPGKVPRQCKVKFLDNGFPVSILIFELS